MVDQKFTPTIDWLSDIALTRTRLNQYFGKDDTAVLGGNLDFLKATQMSETGGEKTISAGAITIDGDYGYYSIDTEADAAADDLDTITVNLSGALAVYDGFILSIVQENAARFVTITSAGNILVANDIVMGSTSRIIKLRYSTALAKWIVLDSSRDLGLSKILQLPGTGASGTITFGSIPTYFRNLKAKGYLKSDGNITFETLYLRLNNISTSTYFYILSTVVKSGLASVTPGASDKGEIARLPGSGAGVDIDSMGWFEVNIPNYADTVRKHSFYSSHGLVPAELDTRPQWGRSSNAETTAGAAVTQLDFILGTGNFTADSRITLYGEF